MAGKEFDHSKYQNWIDPNEVIPYDRNAKIHDEKQAANIANSIHRFGWQQDTVLTSDNVLVIGHGRRLAALKLGCEMPYHRIDKKADEVTDEDIRELRLADNLTNSETGYDFDIGAAEIENLDFDGFDFDFTQFEIGAHESYIDGFFDRGVEIKEKNDLIALKVTFETYDEYESCKTLLETSGYTCKRI